MDKTLIISSDGHAMAKMEDYRAYLPSALHEEFDAFCVTYRKVGLRNVDAAALAGRTDPDVVQEWTTEVIDAGRLDGMSDPNVRMQLMDSDGVAGEVLHPDFGVPFEVGSPFRTASLKHTRTPAQADAGSRAHNRWLADFCQTAPERFAGMATIAFDDVDAAIAEIRWAKDAGLRGVMLPAFDDTVPLFDPRFDPLWSTLEELEMPANSHVGTSSITRRLTPIPDAVPHPGCAIPLFTPQAMFFCHQILNHMIWGGVLERHPKLQVVFTEQGSGWVVGELSSMDYSYDGSYLRKDIREVVRRKPSEYFERQCHLGSSIFSYAEVQARHEIGLSKMMLGIDYPHHEGSWAAGPGALQYFQATLGRAHVPEAEARMLLGENAARTWGFDPSALAPTVARIGLPLDVILTPGNVDEYPRGDVNKPLATAF